MEKKKKKKTGISKKGKERRTINGIAKYWFLYTIYSYCMHQSTRIHIYEKLRSHVNSHVSNLCSLDTSLSTPHLLCPFSFQSSGVLFSFPRKYTNWSTILDDVRRVWEHFLRSIKHDCNFRCRPGKGAERISTNTKVILSNFARG